MKCPRSYCKNKATYDPTYGVLPCQDCQEKDVLKRTGRPDVVGLNKLHRIQHQRDKGGKDLLQPYNGNKVNPEFFKAYPEKVKDYGVEAELKKMI